MLYKADPTLVYTSVNCHHYLPAAENRAVCQSCSYMIPMPTCASRLLYHLIVKNLCYPLVQTHKGDLFIKIFVLKDLYNSLFFHCVFNKRIGPVLEGIHHLYFVYNIHRMQFNPLSQYETKPATKSPQKEDIDAARFMAYNNTLRVVDSCVKFLRMQAWAQLGML